MINHIRTLLLNRPYMYFDGLDNPPYTPTEFVPVVLDAGMKRIKDTIIPVGIDPYTEVSIASSIMKILHCPELEHYTLLPDSRITYSGSDGLSDLPNTSIVKVMTQTPECDIVAHYDLEPTGIPVELSASGVYDWIITALNTNSILIKSPRSGSKEVNIIDLKRPTKSKIVQLIPGYLTIYFDLPSGKVTGSFTLSVSTVVRVLYDIAQYSDALNALMMQPVYSSKIFGQAGNYTSIVQELRNVWLNASEVTVRFGCVVLAYAFQCEAIRSRSNS